MASKNAMLVMTRRRDESILVNRDIEITVVEIRGDKVRLGITAPKEVPVHRREVFEAIHGLHEYLPSPIANADRAPDAEADGAYSLELPRDQAALLDRLCSSWGAPSGVVLRRDQALGAILSAICEAEETLGEPVTLECLKASLASAFKTSFRSK
jgi:carbon storage regulator